MKLRPGLSGKLLAGVHTTVCSCVNRLEMVIWLGEKGCYQVFTDWTVKVKVKS